MYCRNCGEPMNANQAICLKCGVNAGTGNRFCQNCGGQTDANAAVCVHCGVPIKKPVGDLAGQDKTTMAIIAFFLGGLGIHNFMMGETKKGIFKIVMLFCFGLSSIFALVDFIKILTDKYEVNPDKLI